VSTPEWVRHSRWRVEKIRRAVEGRGSTADEDSSVASDFPSDGTVETLTVGVNYAPRKRADVLELDMGDGVVLYDSQSRLVHHLNPSASILWQLSDGAASVAQLAGEASEELRLNSEEVQQQFLGLVAELEMLGLVEDARERLKEGTGDA
jgi:PqqD family protein of HPr-rel-A system